MCDERIHDRGDDIVSVECEKPDHVIIDRYVVRGVSGRVNESTKIKRATSVN